MKRSKIFMGMAALGFAAFGAFAFSPKSAATSAYYIPDGGGCEPTNIVVPCDPNPLGGCTGQQAPFLGKQLYDQGCQNELRPETGF